MKTFVAAVVVTYHRALELERLLDGLASQGAENPGGVIVVDNAREEATRRLVEAKGGVYVPAENLGPGAGWKRGMEEAVERHGGRVTHFWALDDDVVVQPDTLVRLLAGMEQCGADAAAPLLTDAEGTIWAFPEPVDERLRRVIRKVRTPAEAVERLGTAPIEWCWCTGACVLVTRRAVDAVGFHRTDFWMLGEDLELSMRLSARFRCVFLADVIVPHLPSLPSDAEQWRAADRRKFLALLQNLTWLAFHSPHSRHMKRYLPGNFRRWFRTHGWSGSSVADAAACFWKGAIRGVPAGANRPSSRTDEPRAVP